jgi:hypothetical protein
MDTVFANRLLGVLIENAARILRAGYGVNYAESTFFEIVRLLRQESSVVPDFISKVANTLEAVDPGRLEPGMVPRELIELVAYEFRWRALMDLAQQRVQLHFAGDAKLAIGDVSHGIMEAFFDNWADKELYYHYRQT